MTIFRRLRENKTTALRGWKARLFVFAFFTSAVTLTFAAHSSDTEPIVGSEVENRASVSALRPLRLLAMQFCVFRDHNSRKRTTLFGSTISWRAWEANFVFESIRVHLYSPVVDSLWPLALALESVFHLCKSVAQ